VATKDRNAEKDRLQKMALLAEIVGAFAVVVSVVYLAFQISDNTRILRSQAHFNALELSQRPFEIMVETADLAKALVACDDEPFSVSPSDWLRCRNYYFMQFNAWEYLYYQNIDGSVPPELWRGGDAYFSEVARTKAGYTRFWKEGAIAFAEPFRSYAAAQVEKNPASRAK
jgi:hypothetical protein